MSIPETELGLLREAVLSAQKPLFFFDGDTDGLCSYVLLYKLNENAKGVVISGRPQLSEEYVRKIEEYQPDAVFILDIATVTQEFLDATRLPVHWLDHHSPHHGLRLDAHVHYYNPRLYDESDGRPTTYWAYLVARDNLWIAMIGIVGDYYFELADEFKKLRPDLLPLDTINQGEALFHTDLGKLIHIMNFNLKGSVSSAMTSIKVFTRIESPQEILQQTSSRGRFLYKKYERVKQSYDRHIEAIHACVGDDKLILYNYDDRDYSLSGDLANEVKFKNPDKVVIIARHHDGKVIMSLRSERISIHDPLQEALKLTKGYGGGHPKACGAVVGQEDFDAFLEEFKRLLPQTF